MTHEIFLEKLYKLNNTLTVISSYEGSRNQIRIRCNICGCEFETTPNSLLSGSGCPLCARESLYEITRKKHEIFVDEMHTKNQNVDILGIYKNNKTHILVRCKVCGTEWLGMPCHLLRGHGCPSCANERRREALSRGRRK